MSTGNGKLSALRNGSKLKIARLTVGDLPKALHGCMRRGREYRNLLERACAEVHGGVDFTQAHAIDEASGWELHVAVLRWLLRNRLDKMSSADLIVCSKEMAKARRSRNEVVERMGLKPPKVEGDDGLLSQVSKAVHLLTLEQRRELQGIVDQAVEFAEQAMPPRLTGGSESDVSADGSDHQEMAAESEHGAGVTADEDMGGVGSDEV